MKQGHEKYQRLIDRCKSLAPTPTAVAHPCDESSLQGAVDAAKAGLIAPILVGPASRIKEVAAKAGLDISAFPIIDAAFSQDSATKAVAEVRAGRAEALMKGSLHTDELMGAVVRRETGLRTARRISHCFVMDVPGHADPLIITDAAVNIAPDAPGQDRHRAECDRPCARSGFEGSARGDPVGDGNGQSRRALHARGGRAVQDGRPQADHRRAARRPARARQRDQPRGRQDQENRFAGRGTRQRAGGAGPRSGQHAREEPDLPRRRRRRRHRAGRARADHSDQPRGFADCAARFVRGGGPGRPRPPRKRRQSKSRDAMADVILVLNAGSSSIKFSPFGSRRPSRSF